MVSMTAFVESFFILFAFMRMTGMTTTNPFSLVLFLVFTYICNAFQRSISESRFGKSDHIHASILAAFFTLLTLFVSYGKVTSDMTSMLFCAVILAATAIGLFLCCYHVLLWIFLKTSSLTLTRNFYPVSWLAYATFAGCILFWLPYFLHEFPGVMTPDSINHFAQAVGIWELSNQHSVLYTMLMLFFYKTGLALTGNPTIAISFFTLFQMLFMAFTAAYTVRTLQLTGLKTALCVAAGCFYILLPYHGALSVTLWKDVAFAGCVTLFTASCIRILLLDANSRPKFKELLGIFLPYVLSGFAVCLLRTNGMYAFLISIPFILIVFKEHWKHLLPATLLALVLALFVRYPCMQIYEIGQADFAESCSIPLQQMARVVALGENLTAEQESRLAEFMDISAVANAYDPHVSDPIKALVREKGILYLEENKGEFFSLWLSVGWQHPKTYFDAFVQQTYGYWYPDAYTDVGLADGIYPNDFGLEWSPLLKGSIIVKIRELLFKFQQIIPLYGLLWSVGAAFWTILICIGICFCRGNSSTAVLCVFPVALTLTLTLASPVAVEFRYAYSLLYALPLYLSVPYIKTR